MQNKAIILITMTMLSGTFACSKSTPSPYNGTFQGTESGTQNGTAFSQTTLFTLTQTGSSVTGKYTINDKDVGTIAGTASGYTLNFTVTQTPIGGCFGTLTGTSTINGNFLNGTLSAPAKGSCGAYSSSYQLLYFDFDLVGPSPTPS